MADGGSSSDNVHIFGGCPRKLQEETKDALLTRRQKDERKRQEAEKVDECSVRPKGGDTTGCSA
jgi:hypothetical protein